MAGAAKRERGRETAETGAVRAGFLPSLHLILSSLRPSTETLFIGGGRG